MVDPNGLAFSHRRITLSTAGLVPQLRQLGKESPVNLAISLHAPDDALRSELMPINRKYPLAELWPPAGNTPCPRGSELPSNIFFLMGSMTLRNRLVTSSGFSMACAQR